MTLECKGGAVPLNLVRLQIVKPWQRELEGKQFSFCVDPDCRIVYFTPDGDTFTVDDLRHAPAYKTGDDQDLLCFCFQMTGADLVSGHRVPYIRQRVKRGECACDVLNPSGRCCLGSIGRWQKAHHGRLGG